MRTFRIDFSGGMTFKGYPAQNQVRLLDNAQVMGNAIESHRVPLATGPRTHSDVIQIFWYRGRFLTSTKKRSYLPEYIGGNERIIFTEYGTYPKKQINSYETYLGVIRPTLQPTLDAGSEIVMAAPKVTEALGLGTVAKGVTRGYRLAIKTAFGILPPSGRTTGTATADKSGFDLEWAVPDLEIPFIGFMVFGGNDGSEKMPLLAEVSATTTTYRDDGTGGAVPDDASNYDQAAELQYGYTFFQNLDGITAESAPSPITGFIAGSTSRLLKFNLDNDGYWDQQGLLTTILTGVAFADTSFEAETTTHGETYTLNDLYFDGYKGFGQVTFADHLEGGKVAKGEMLLANWAGHPSDQHAVRVWEVSPDGSKAWLDLDETAVGAGIVSGSTLQRVNHGAITNAEWNGDYQMVIFTTDGPHCMMELDRIVVDIPEDKNYNAKVFEVVRIYGKEDQFGIRNYPMPKTLTGTWKRPVYRVKLPVAWVDGKTYPFPETGDFLRLNYQVDETNIYGALTMAKRAPYALYLTQRFGTALKTTPALLSLSLEWYPRNNGITHRVVYRTGDTAEFLKVEEVPLDQDEYFDFKDTANLSYPIPTYRVTNGKVVLETPPPTTLERLAEIYGIRFAIDGHDVRWTPTNKPDGWPDAYRHRFAYKPVEIKPYNQAMTVLCEDGLYRLDGSDPDYLTISKTRAEDGCLAGDTVQVTHVGLVYLGRRGLYVFNGQDAVCVTEHKMDAGQLAGTAFIPGDAFWWLPNADTKAFAHALYADWDGWLRHEVVVTHDEGGDIITDYHYPLIHTEWIGTWLDLAYNLKSFVWDGCYYMYSGGYDENYNGMGMWMMDLRREGFPLYHVGLHPIHVHVTDLEEVFVLVPAGPASTTLTVEELP